MSTHGDTDSSVNDTQGWRVRPVAMQAAIDGLRESNPALRRAADGRTIDATASRITELTDILQRYLLVTLHILLQTIRSPRAAGFVAW